MSFYLVSMQVFSSNITRGMKEQRDRPYACNICEKKFCRSTHLRRHQTKSHGRIPNPNRVEGYYRNVHKAAVDSQNSDNIYLHHNASQWKLFIDHKKKKMTTWNTISPRCWLVAMWWHHFATFDDIILQHLMTSFWMTCTFWILNKQVKNSFLKLCTIFHRSSLDLDLD